MITLELQAGRLRILPPLSPERLLHLFLTWTAVVGFSFFVDLLLFKSSFRL